MCHARRTWRDIVFCYGKHVIGQDQQRGEAGANGKGLGSAQRTGARRWTEGMDSWGFRKGDGVPSRLTA